jgi:hypothetical protein
MSYSEAYKNGQTAYKERPWVIDIPNPYNQGTAEFEEFEKGWSDAEFLDKVDAGYFDWC